MFGYDSLKNYYMTNFSLMQHHKYSLAELETMYVEELMETKDANEGINAFIEKRKPNWINK